MSEVNQVSGDSSIAVVRGKPKMGFDLYLKIELTGNIGTDLEGLVSQIEISGLTEDKLSEAENVTLRIIKFTNSN